MKIVAMQADALTTLNVESDTTLALALEAQKRGYSLFWYSPDKLSVNQSKVCTFGEYIKLKDGRENFFEVLKSDTLVLDQADFVLMRQDPPFNMNYINATYLLEMSDVRVLNNPRAVRDNPEKLIPFKFPHLMPETIITRRFEEVEKFFEERRDIVVKPLHLFGGKGVFRIREKENLASLIEFMELTIAEPIVVQEFLPAVMNSEKRVIIINGEVAGSILRVPNNGEIRSNLRVGGTAQKTELTKIEAEICEEVGEFLSENDIFIAGLDLIGGKLTEVNITSPTGIRAINKLYGIALHEVFWDNLLV